MEDRVSLSLLLRGDRPSMPPTDYQEEKGAFQLIITMILPLHNLSKAVVVFVDKWNKSQHYECHTVKSRPQFDIFSANHCYAPPSQAGRWDVIGDLKR